jgi:hypothetical protein
LAGCPWKAASQKLLSSMALPPSSTISWAVPFGTGLIPPLTILQFKPDRLSSGLKHLLANEVFEIKAGYVQPPAVEHTIANMKVLPHKMVERHTASSKVAPMLVGRQVDPAATSERLQHLDFDQCHLTIDMLLLGICPESRRVTVAFNAEACDQSGCPRPGRIYGWER